MESQKVRNESEDKGESEEATVGIESDGRRKEIAEYKYKSQRKLRLFFVIKVIIGLYKYNVITI